MSKFPVKATFLEKVQNESGIYVLEQCLEVWHSVIFLTNMGVFIAVDENVTDGDIAITGDTIWSLFPVEQISMGEVSVADSCPSQYQIISSFSGGCITHSPDRWFDLVKFVIWERIPQLLPF